LCSASLRRAYCSSTASTGAPTKPTWRSSLCKETQGVAKAYEQANSDRRLRCFVGDREATSRGGAIRRHRNVVVYAPRLAGPQTRSIVDALLNTRTIGGAGGAYRLIGPQQRPRDDRDPRQEFRSLPRWGAALPGKAGQPKSRNAGYTDDATKMQI
jgi:hypothetical protein